MARVRRVRVLIYEGPEEWVERTTEAEARYVKGTVVVSTKAPEHLPYEARPISEAPIPNCTITEFLTGMERI